MPTAPVPGRIPPIQTGKIPGGSTASQAKEVATDPKAAIADKTIGAVTKHFSAADSQKRFNKALRKAHASGRVPLEPKYRISMLAGGILIGSCIAVDTIDAIAGYFAEVVVGEVIVVIVDTIWAVVMVLICRFLFKLPFSSHLKIYISITCFMLIEYIPFLTINDAWWLDAWYIIHTIRAEDRKIHEQLLQTIQQEKEEEEKQNFMRDFEEQQAKDAEAVENEPQVVV